nr:DNA polymerase domain-containing protein [Vibrio anguillarum]
MNSFYGVLGSSGCRFFDTRLASSITMRGHEIMKTPNNCRGARLSSYLW